MASRGRTSAPWINAAVFIVLEIAALSLLRSTSELQDIWISRAEHNVSAWTWGQLDKLHSYASLRSQNEMLAASNYELFKELQACNSLKSS